MNSIEKVIPAKAEYLIHMNRSQMGNSFHGLVLPKPGEATRAMSGLGCRSNWPRGHLRRFGRKKSFRDNLQCK
jgi:hypothetical protein